MRPVLWLCLWLAAALASAAPQLAVPHGRLGQAGPEGPSAIWRGEDGGAFLIQTSGDILNAAGTVQRRTFDIGRDGVAIIGQQPLWDAAGLLADASQRQIFTSDAAGATVAFAWSSLPQATRALLDQPNPSW